VVCRCRRLPRGEDQRCALDVTGPLLVGGLPDHFSLDSLRVSSSNLVGCIRDLYINYKHMDFGAAVSKYNTQDGCVYKRDFCITLPCRNKGMHFTVILVVIEIVILLCKYYVNVVFSMKTFFY